MGEIFNICVQLENTGEVPNPCFTLEFTKETDFLIGEFYQVVSER